MKGFKNILPYKKITLHVENNAVASKNVLFLSDEIVDN